MFLVWLYSTQNTSSTWNTSNTSVCDWSVLWRITESPLGIKEELMATRMILIVSKTDHYSFANKDHSLLWWYEFTNLLENLLGCLASPTLCQLVSFGNAIIFLCNKRAIQCTNLFISKHFVCEQNAHTCKVKGCISKYFMFYSVEQ